MTEEIEQHDPPIPVANDFVCRHPKCTRRVPRAFLQVSPSSVPLLACFRHVVWALDWIPTFSHGVIRKIKVGLATDFATPEEFRKHFQAAKEMAEAIQSEGSSPEPW